MAADLTMVSRTDSGETYNKIAGRRLPVPAKTDKRLASWSDLGVWEMLIGSFWDLDLRSVHIFSRIAILEFQIPILPSLPYQNILTVF